VTKDEELRMSFTEHLGELRDRIIYSGIAVLVSFFICYAASDYLFYVIARPLDPLAQSELIKWITDATGMGAAPAADGKPAPTAEWITLNPLEGFMVKFKLGVYFGLLTSLPFILYQVCAFIFPGLKPSERKLLQLLVAGCSVLGTAGVVVAYFGVFPLVLPYLLEWTPEGVTVQLRMSETINIILLGMVGFAVAFQFPMAVLALVYVGVLTPEMLRKQRRLAIVGLAVAAAVLTPPDPISMIIMLVPLVLLYEFSIVVGSFIARKRTGTDIVPTQE
jgi:sec-independent protein translocase protein TatC